jgi:hypothetical protein
MYEFFEFYIYIHMKNFCMLKLAKMVAMLPEILSDILNVVGICVK